MKRVPSDHILFTATGAPMLQKKAPARGKISILVVDDLEEARELVCTVIHDMQIGLDLNPIAAKNGAQALSVLETHSIDLVLADWRMPEMSGLDLLKEIRQNENWKHIPVIMLTAVSGETEVKEAIESGVTDYLLKPFTILALEKKIQAVLNKVKQAAPA